MVQKFIHEAREIWQKYGAKGDFTGWFKRLQKKHNFIPGKDFDSCSTKKMSKINAWGGNNKKDLFLTEKCLRIIQISHGDFKAQVIAKVVEKTLEVDKNLKGDMISLSSIFTPSGYDFGIEMLTHLKKESNELEQTTKKLEQTQIKLDSNTAKMNELMHSNETMSTSQLAKDLGYNSSTELYKILNEGRYLFKRGGYWEPYAHKVPHECFHIKYIQANNGNYYPSLGWTPQGKLWVSYILKKNKDNEGITFYNGALQGFGEIT